MYFGRPMMGRPEFLHIPFRPYAPASANSLSPARRVRRVFMRVGLLVSILTFIVVAGDVLLEQLIGRASASFVFWDSVPDRGSLRRAVRIRCHDWIGDLWCTW